MHLTLEERETTILFNEADKEAEVCTCNKSLMRKLDDFCGRSKAINLIREDEHSKTYLFPKKWVKVQMPRELSDEQRKKMSVRAKEIFSSRKNTTEE